MPKNAKAMVILVVVCLFGIARAGERSKGKAAEVLTPDHNLRSLIPAQEQITQSSLVNSTGDDATTTTSGDVVDSDHDNDIEPAVVPPPLPLDQPRVDPVPANSPNDHISITITINQVGDDPVPAESSGQRIATVSCSTTASSSMVATNSSLAEYRERVPASQSSSQTMVTGSLNTETPTEGRGNGVFFALSNETLLVMSFTAAVALMTVGFQNQGNLSPSSSSSASLPMSSFPLAMVWTADVCCFAVTVMGMLLRNFYPTTANLCHYAGILSIVLVFLSMMGMFVPGHFAWTVWATAIILLLGFAYAITRR